jgi:cation:H+ antiporter
MPPLLVGLTVVSFATSAPELAVSLDAALSGTPGLAVGNVIGSNIANVLLVLGVAALVGPILVQAQLVRLDVPVLIAFSVALLVFALDGAVSRLEGAVLLAALVGYLAVAVRLVRRTRADVASSSAATAGTAPRPGVGRDLVLVLAGVALLVVGAGRLVDGASEIAASLGVSELVIGLTVVAVGTSVPELVTTVIAAVRGQRDLAVGNAVGSCLFNIGAVLAVTAIAAPDGVPVADEAIAFDLPFMVATAVALLPVAVSGLTIQRWEGALFVGYYVAYLTFLVLQATEHAALRPFSVAMLAFVIPITVVTVLVVMIGDLARRRAGAPAG